MELSAIARYPIKSCRGVALEYAPVRPWGLKGDRRWMLIDARGEVVTAREYPQLVLVEVELLPVDATGGDRHDLRIRAKGRPDLTVIEPAQSDQLPASIWRTLVAAKPAAEAAHDWFSELLGRPVRLVFLDDPTSRRVDPNYSQPGDVVSFADAYPLLLANVDSLTALNDLVRAGRWADEGPLPMTRFRPNVTVAGAGAWAEDDWKRIRIGAVTFRAARLSSRCVLTTVDPWTAAKGKEPLATLGRHRNWDGKLWFGMNLIPDLGDAGQAGPAPVLRLGDPVEVLA